MTIHSSSQRALSKPQTLKRVEQYVPQNHKIHAPKNQDINVPHGSTITEPRRCRWKTQPPFLITVPAVKQRPPKYAALKTLNPSMLPNTRTNYRPSGNKSRRQSKRVSEFPSISSPLPSYPTVISPIFFSPSGLRNYIGEKSVTATREQLPGPPGQWT